MSISGNTNHFGDHNIIQIKIQKWHGIEKGRALIDTDVDFIVALIMGSIERQL